MDRRDRRDRRDHTVHRAANTGYGRASDVYAEVRPSYHPALVARFIERFGHGPLAEIGAGSGIFTRQLLDGGCQPIAVEPVDSMRAKLAANLPSLSVLGGTAEATGLPDDGVETIVAAQAFHWFDHGKTLNEMARVLRPGGYLVCVWNVRDESVPWVAEYTEIVDRYAGDTPRYRTMHWRRAIDGDPRFAGVDDWSIPNPIEATPESVVGRALSTSFIASLNPTAQQEALAAVRTLAESQGDHFDFPYRCELQAWSLSG